MRHSLLLLIKGGKIKKNNDIKQMFMAKLYIAEAAASNKFPQD